MNPVSLLKEASYLAKGAEVYVAGGPVRDWLLGRGVTDIDLVLSQDAIETARALSQKLGGAFVMLDERFHVARVVFGDFCLDFSQFRGNSKNILEDLSHRDFTINAMALPLEEVASRLTLTSRGLVCQLEELTSQIIDPFSGQKDVQKRTIRAIAEENLVHDPLRLLRAFRFSATLDFTIDKKTLEWIRSHAEKIARPAPERIDQEFDKIMASNRAGHTFLELYQFGLLPVIIPETRQMEGVDQPGFHHLDVLGHLFEALSSMDRLVENPCIKFPECDAFKEWLSQNKEKTTWLKWAAFMHDFGKPAKKATKENGRVTFYEHDKEGAAMVKAVAKRLRWSKEKGRFVSTLVRLHMRPFHLLNDLRRSGPSKRAMRRLLDDIGTNYPALFLLAMADSMAGCGPMKPEGLDDEIALLFNKIHTFYLKSLKPVEENPPLVTGHDVMKLLGISPGPTVGEALSLVRQAQVEGTVSSKEEALELIRQEFAK